jgi:hypothetical protein
LDFLSRDDEKELGQTVERCSLPVSHVFAELVSFQQTASGFQDGIDVVRYRPVELIRFQSAWLRPKNVL